LIVLRLTLSSIALAPFFDIGTPEVSINQKSRTLKHGFIKFSLRFLEKVIAAVPEGDHPSPILKTSIR